MAILEVKVPKFLESVTEGTLLRWHKRVGQTIAQDETLAEIETDKIVLEIPSPFTGVLTEILKSPEDIVVAGQVIAKIDADCRPFEPTNEHRTAIGTVIPHQIENANDNRPVKDQVTRGRNSHRVPKSVVFGASQETDIVGKGGDVPVQADSRSGAYQEERREQRVPMSRPRARIAQRLLQSQATTATLTTFNEVDMQALIDWRRRRKERLKQETGIALGFTAFFVKAAVEALKQYPILNASVSGNDIVYHRYFDIGIAVDSPRGLVVPILRNADRMSIAEIEKKIREFGEKAKEGILTLDDLAGGTFTISNGGIYGSMLSLPIINPPQSAILGIHATINRPVAENERIVIRPMTYLALSYDHRIIDGREAVLGLAAMKQALEDPMRWLIPEAQDEEAFTLSIPARGEPSSSFGLGTVELPPSSDDRRPEIRAHVELSAKHLEGRGLLSELTTGLADILCVEPRAINPDAQFTELGLDSVHAVDWTDEINRKYGTSVMATMIYAYPTVRQFAAFLSSRLIRSGAGDAVDQAHVKIEQSCVAESSGCAPSANAHTKTKGAPPPKTEAIAIVGMSGRYPEAGTLERYWDNLCLSKNSIVEIPRSRWNVDDYYDQRLFQTGKTSSKWLGLMDGVESFDPLFFSISPADAELMDPQQRIFLEEAYRAFENAGYAPESLSDQRCGVYLGLCNNDYGLLLRKGDTGIADRLGNSGAITSARIAYYLNLKGPAITVDTACSSSLVAIHLACQALCSGETDLALAGGVSLFLAPELYICWSSAGVLSPSGQCKAFDNRADGFVPGEGVGAVVLKRLSDAERDGDNIIGVLIGSGINQDGKTNGITAPSMTRQAELVRETYARYGINAESISYVEAHGTGTKLGDPIELEALSKAFRKDTAALNYCAIGSVKSNIGHTIAAAGIAGVHKVLLSLINRKLPPTINFNNPNEHFDFSASPFFVNTTLRNWETENGQPRRAAVSSFGISGTNAHLVIEEYIPAEGQEEAPKDKLDQPLLFILSARTENQLKAYATLLMNHIESHAEIDLVATAYTLQVGRNAMEHRLTFLASSREMLLKMLKDYIHGILSDWVKRGLVQKREDVHNQDVDSLAPGWAADMKLSQIAEIWVAGGNINWRQLYGSASPRRIALPTYPFARERYWVPEQSGHDGIALADRQYGPNARAASRIVTRSSTCPQKFDSNFWGRLIDGVMNGEFNADAAAQCAKKMMFPK